MEEYETETRAEELRAKLTAESEQAAARPGAKVAAAKGLKSHQVHELAAAKIEESEKLRRALGIRKDYEEGSHWKKQEERLRMAVQEEEEEEEEGPTCRDGEPEKERKGRRRY